MYRDASKTLGGRRRLGGLASVSEEATSPPTPLHPGPLTADCWPLTARETHRIYYTIFSHPGGPA